MPLTDLDLFLFDFAGTTVRDDGIALRAYRSVLDANALRADDAFLTARMGMSKPEVLADVLADNGATGDPAALARDFEREMVRAFERHAPIPLAGAERSIEALRGQGLLVGFTTGFSRRVCDLILGRLRWRSDVDVTSDEVDRGRPAPDLIREAMRRTGIRDARKVAVCGDTPSDLLAGDAAGCGAIIGVGHGTHYLEELRAFPHTLLLADLTGLVPALG